MTHLSTFQTGRMLTPVVVLLLVPALTFGLKWSINHNVFAPATCATTTAALEAIDSVSILSKDSVLILGDTAVKRWLSKPEKLAGRPVLMRSVAGLTPEGVANCFERTVAFYRPAATLVMIELDDALNRPGEIMRSLDRLLERRDYFAVSPRFDLVVPPTTPRHFARRAELNAFKAELRGWAGRTNDVRVFDPDIALLEEFGDPAPYLFWPDGATLSEEGYALLTPYLSTQLAADLP